MLLLRYLFSIHSHFTLTYMDILPQLPQLTRTLTWYRATCIYPRYYATIFPLVYLEIVCTF